MPSVSFCKVLIASAHSGLLVLDADDREMILIDGGFDAHARLITKLSKGEYALVEKKVGNALQWRIEKCETIEHT